MQTVCELTWVVTHRFDILVAADELSGALTRGKMLPETLALATALALALALAAPLLEAGGEGLQNTCRGIDISICPTSRMQFEAQG